MSDRNRPGAIRRAWLRIREPRVLRIVYFFGYLIGLVGGYEATINAPTSLLPFFQGWAPYWSGLILGGCAIGLLTVFLKEWWIETVGAVAATGGYLLYAVVVLGIHFFVADAGQRLTQGTACLLAAGFFLVRIIILRMDISRLTRPVPLEVAEQKD